jgi:hypothetical protein
MLFRPSLRKRLTRILSLSRLSILCNGGGCLQDPLSVTALHSKLWEEDDSMILSLSSLSVLRYGGGCLQDPFTVTPLCPPLWRRMSPGSFYRHASSSSVMVEDVSRILSPSRLFVLCYGGGCLQDPFTVMPLCPLLWRRISPGFSHRHASSSSVMEEDVSKILSPSCLSVLRYSGLVPILYMVPC